MPVHCDPGAGPRDASARWKEPSGVFAMLARHGGAAMGKVASPLVLEACRRGGGCWIGPARAVLAEVVVGVCTAKKIPQGKGFCGSRGTFASSWGGDRGIRQRSARPPHMIPPVRSFQESSGTHSSWIWPPFCLIDGDVERARLRVTGRKA